MNQPAKQIGLRIDVDTFRGTGRGVPELCRLLRAAQVRGSFFFSVGPDNMGRHLWRLLRPAFLLKMLRSRAASLYGWDILFKGAFWPGPPIGRRWADVIRAAAADGHEIGLHAWDHQRWQAHMEKWDAAAQRREIQRGFDELSRILGRNPDCSAAPGWKANAVTLAEKDAFSFRYNSDCRGEAIFQPVVGERVLNTPQIPVTLPTYDEVVGRNGVTANNFNAHLLRLLRPGRLNVLTIHAEVEGGIAAGMFADFLRRAQSAGWMFLPLGALLDSGFRPPAAEIEARSISGREGWVACQTAAP